MRVLHFGSYWQKENDIIYAMVKDLSKVSETMIIDTHLYDQDKDIYVIDDFSNDSSHPVKWLREEKVMPLIDQFKPSIVIVNAGSMSLTVNTLFILRKMGSERLAFLSLIQMYTHITVGYTLNFMTSFIRTPSILTKITMSKIRIFILCLLRHLQIYTSR